MSPRPGGDILGIDAAELGSFDVVGTTLTGTANKVTVPDFNGKGRPQAGYFVAMRFDPAPAKFYTEKHPEGKEGDVDLLMMLGEEAPTATWLEVEMQDGSRVRYTFDVKAGEDRTSPSEPKLVNAIGATKWGFCKDKTDLDTAVGPGESAYIDHDEDVFYWVGKAKAGADFARYVTVVGVDGKLYASLPGGDYQYHYAGLGANDDGSHQTDFNWVSADEGASWAKNETAHDVSGKAATLEVRKFSEAVSDGNAQTVLATGGEVVLGPQAMTCDQTRSYQATEAASYASMTKAQLVAEAGSRGIAVPRGATKAQIRKALEG